MPKVNSECILGFDVLVVAQACVHAKPQERHPPNKQQQVATFCVRLKLEHNSSRMLRTLPSFAHQFAQANRATRVTRVGLPRHVLNRSLSTQPSPQCREEDHDAHIERLNNDIDRLHREKFDLKETVDSKTITILFMIPATVWGCVGMISSLFR